MEANEHVVIFVTAKDDSEAQDLAKGLIESKLVACANIVPAIRSLFWWEGAIDEAQEVLIILKTRAALIEKVTAKVKALHSYMVPEVIALPIVGGSKDYLHWINDSLK